MATKCTYPYSTPQWASAPYRCYLLVNHFEYIDRRTYPGMSWAGHIALKIAPSCVWIWTPWFPRLAQVHIPNGSSIGSAVFAQLTTECHYTLQWVASSPQNSSFARRSWPHLIHGFLGQPEFTSQTTCRSLKSFVRGSRSWQTDIRTTL